MNFGIRRDLHVEEFDGKIMVLVPDRAVVLELSGAQAEAFRVARAGTDTVPPHLTSAMAGLCEVGIVESATWTRRQVIHLGGAAAATGIAVVALPGVAAAASGTTNTTLPPQPLANVEERASNTSPLPDLTDYRIQVSGNPAVARIVDTTTPDGSGRTNVQVVTGLAAGPSRVSFQEVDSSGIPTSPARYLAPDGFDFAAPPLLALAIDLPLSFQTVPTDATQAATFAQLASYTRITPGNAAVGVVDGHSFQSLVSPNYYLVHSDGVLRVHTGSGFIFGFDSTWTTLTV